MPPTNANTSLTPTTQKDSSSSPTSQQQQLRPPLYNAEDYASALRALFTTSLSLPSEPAPPPTSLILEHSTTHPPLIPGQGLVDMNKHVSKVPEMSMKKFINGSELLFKLEADLRSAFPSFVQEFVSGDSDGVGCIIDALRTVHEALDHVNGLREQRKLVLDERSCVQCLHLMMKNLDAIPKLLGYPHGLYPIVHCTVSTNTSTRVLSLEILTQICEQGGPDAFAKVSEAISTLRLRLGEPIRCKVLVGAIASAAAGVFQATGVRFFKSYVGAAPSAKFRVYLQVELEEAGFQVDVIRKSAELSPARESRLVLQELDEWDRVIVDVDTVVRQNAQLRNSVATLQQEIATLKDKIKKQENSSPPYHPTSSQQQQHKYTKKRSTQPTRQALSSTPIQTITTPVDSEEEAEQIHQILEDLHNIVNNEMLNNENSNSSTTTGASSEIVPVVSNRAPLRSNNVGHHHRGVVALSEPNLFESSVADSSTVYNSDTEGNGGSGGRVKDVVQQLENSSVLFNTLPNFNTGPLASKFANFKSSKLDGGGHPRNNQGWGENEANSRVKSLENLDNFTLKWKYPVVVGEGGKGQPNQNLPMQLQQPNSLVVLQDYRMNRFGMNKQQAQPQPSPQQQPSSKDSSDHRRQQSPGLFSKNKKKHLVHHPQKTFQISMVSKGGEGKVNNMSGGGNFNDLGGGGGSGSSSNSPTSLMERVTDLPSGMY